MMVAVREYSGPGSKELFDVLEKRTAEIRKEIGTVKGLVHYSLVRTVWGGFSVTVCQDQAGIDDSIEKARNWTMKHASKTGVLPPRVSSGPAIISM